ncbi:carbohydrate ABC transporter substrate-binding protein (CUT1 family) [Murinocardiopsis flavida]|uniref:Carbohydrate ABC transporter substrate-binding protein (CUT1 family) n=1 Tax=Murinocardiopsis flavida TaxID=645275 RepID=A0A2P8D568_9ACTN|nr:ABC transporter substrate-binding protein [Murinocardiopsis flavida]PSK92366.1 carbohydrate ABC transporter substrate-binding protein (CUT1 family) [Murinocardiopsis flavida]
MSHQLSRRSLLHGGAVLAGASLLGGCGGAGSGADVSYWAAFPSKPTEKYFREHYVDAFNKTSDSAQVSMSVKQLTNLAQLTDTAVSAGRAPDIVYSPGPSAVAGYAKSFKIRELGDYASDFKWKDALLPWAYQLSQVDNKIFSVPTSYGSMVLYYNPATFEKYGWEPPTTKQEFEDLCADAKSEGLIPVGAGNSGYKAQTEWYLTAFLNMAVGPNRLYEVLTSSRDFDDEAIVDAVSLMKSQMDKGWWGGGTKDYFTTTDPDVLTGLAKGDVAMYISGTWSFGSIATFFGKDAGNDADWDWAPLPSLSSDVDPGVFPLAIGTSLALSADEKKGDGAVAFLDFLINDPGRALGYLAATGENPPPIKVESGDFPDDTDKRSERLYNAIPKSTNLGYTSWTFLPPRSNSFFYEEFDKVITGDLPPKEYCSGLAGQFTQETGEGVVPNAFTPEAD